MKSKLLGLMALVSLVLALSGGAASAVTFDWSTSGPLGSGTFTATSEGSDEYLITAITGTFDGGTITSLIAPSTYKGNGNLLFYPLTPQLNGDGVAFVDGGTDFDIYIGGSGGYYFVSGAPGAIVGGTVSSFAASTSITPLPAALPLFATGIGAMGLLGWRKKRKNAAALAAA